MFRFRGLGFAGSDPGYGRGTIGSHAVVGVPHIMWRKMGADVSSGPVFLQKQKKITTAADVVLKKKYVCGPHYISFDLWCSV